MKVKCLVLGGLGIVVGVCVCERHEGQVSCAWWFGYCCVCVCVCETWRSDVLCLMVWVLLLSVCVCECV